MWQDGPLSRPVFKATMSIKRFEMIRRCLRFDNKDSREVRSENGGKFAPFNEIWNKFIQQCKVTYEPFEMLCIDEQRIPFHGRCSFRQYLRWDSLYRKGDE